MGQLSCNIHFPLILLQLPFAILYAQIFNLTLVSKPEDMRWRLQRRVRPKEFSKVFW